ncbi:MAG: hypothetical protein ACKV2O_21485 [Acidimicrobiales bacterium]
MTGTSTQGLDLFSTVDARHQMGTVDEVIRFEDRVDLTAVRGTEASGVAPLWITVEALQLGERNIASGARTGLESPAPGASICILQGTSGQAVLNSSTERWGRDTAGVLQMVMAANFVVFPDTAVGRGARWTMVQTMNQDGFSEVRTWSYELVSIDESGYELRGEVTSAWDEPLQTPQSLSGSDLVRTASGQFSAVGRFDQPFPASGTFTGASTNRSASMQMDSTSTQTLVVTGH